ncbi:MAG: hypothetical protein IJW21_09975 [Clostridia bacterium]|nr:hypothetical protein [Clostridia bacterium]
MKKNEKLQEALGMVGGDLVEDAHAAPKRKALPKRIKWAAAIAATLALFMLAGTLRWLFPGTGAPQALSPFVLAYAAYPEDEKAPNKSDYENENEYFSAVSLWNSNRNAEIREFRSKGINIDEFTAITSPEMLAGSEGENALYSPLNIYVMLAMLAEITGGESRGQILALLGEESVEALREKASALWNAAYKDNGVAKSLLSSSVWLSNSEKYNTETLQNLAKYYYASTFSGEMGSAEYNAALQSWLNEGTKGLLSDRISEIEFDADTFMALAATVYFSAPWENEFPVQKTQKGIFHSPSGDTEREFMNSDYSFGYYYRGENFSAAYKSLECSGSMYFILPDEGITPEELLGKEDFGDFLRGGGATDKKFMEISLSVPKFDVSSQSDLKSKLENLGVTDIFSDTTADFTPITKKTIFASDVIHGVRVRIDEKSCEAASYAVVIMEATGAPSGEKINLVLDRPFIFLIKNEMGLPLFIGIVNNP